MGLITFIQKLFGPNPAKVDAAARGIDNKDLTDFYKQTDATLNDPSNWTWFGTCTVEVPPELRPYVQEIGEHYTNKGWRLEHSLERQDETPAVRPSPEDIKATKALEKDMGLDGIPDPPPKTTTPKMVRIITFYGN